MYQVAITGYDLIGWADAIESVMMQRLESVDRGLIKRNDAVLG